MNKTCTKCKLEKPEEEFFWHNKSKNRRHVSCKECNSFTRSDQGIANRKVSNRVGSSLRRNRNRQFIFDHLLANPCKSCGEKDPVLLEFDHVDPNTKHRNVSNMITSEFSIAKIAEEINKCNVLCVSCHRRRTAKQFGWWKLANADSDQT